MWKLLFYRGLHFILRRIVSLDEKIVEHITQMSKPSADYTKLIHPFQRHELFFDSIRIITHAGGGLAGIPYLNCEEAYPVYRSHGNYVFEYDVDKFESNQYVLTHGGDGICQIDDRFTPMRIEQLFELLYADKKLIVIFDCKFHNLKEFSQYIKKQCRDTDSLNRIIIQIFDEKNIEEVRSVYGFQMLFVCMTNTDYCDAANICLRNDIHAVSIPAKAFEERSDWDVFVKSNISMFAYSVNTVKQYNELKQKAVTGVFSDYLRQNDIERG